MEKLTVKNKKSNQENTVVKKFLKCKLYKIYQVNVFQNFLNLNLILK